MKEVQNNKEEKVVQTLCQNCVFAEHEDSGPEDRVVQTGCSLGRLEKLEANGATISNVVGKKEDFYVIEGRICNTCRGPKWKNDVEEKGINDIKLYVRDEINVKCTFIVYLGPGQAIEDAAYTAKSIDEQDLPASKIIIMNNSGVQPMDFVNQFREFNVKTEWYMEYVAEMQSEDVLAALEGEDRIVKDQLIQEMYMRCIDLGAKKTKTIYYAVFNAGDKVPTNYLHDIDVALNDDLVRILALTPEESNSGGQFVHQALHSQIGGNKERPCLDKIITQTENQECPELVKPVTEIVKDFVLQ